MNKKLLILIGILLAVNIYLISAVSIVDVSSSPTEVAPGQVVEIFLEIENILDYNIKNVNIKLNLAGDIPFAPYQSSSERVLDELDEGDEESFEFKLIVLPETASGIYKIPIEISYEDEFGNSSLKKDLMSLIVNSEPDLKVSAIDSQALIRGKENSFSIKIVNSGLSDIKFVYLTLSDSSGVKFLCEKEQYIGDLDSDDFDSITCNIHISETTKSTVSLPIILKYKDATTKEFTEIQKITLKTYSLKDAQRLGIVKKPSYRWYLLIVSLIVLYICYKIWKKRKLKARTG